MVQAGESKATQMTKSLSESKSVDGHSKAGERSFFVRMYVQRKCTKMMMAPKKKKMKTKMRRSKQHVQAEP
jgi:hypothetical protein